MKVKYVLVAIGLISMMTTSCNNSNQNGEGDNEKKDSLATVDKTATEGNKSEKIVYEAQLTSLNDKITGTKTTGTAQFVIDGENMKVTIDVKGAPAGIEHWQHFHGFINGDNATCASADQDANGDGIVDIVETEKVSGTTMVPFNAIPTNMKLGDDSYPIADKEGNYHYEATITMSDLKKVFANAFKGADVNLDSRVLYIHGIPKDTKLPKSVKTVADIPAQITLPIACGEIHIVK